MNQSSDFYNLGIAPNILEILHRLNFKIPTPIQEKSIPLAIEGKDMIGIAQTGTGKTLAFAVPMIQAALRGNKGLIVLPTRELALQVNEVFRKVGSSLGVRTAVLIGGESINRQVQALRGSPQIIIGTPGRIIDHLEQKTVSLGAVAVLVLDEADHMLDMGFAPQLKRILQALPRNRQTLLFSATMPQDIFDIAKTYMKLPVRIEVAPSGTPAAKVTQELFFLEKQDKPRLLQKILGEYRGSILIFARTKHGARKITQGIRTLGHIVAEIHSNKSLNQRREALDGFRNGKYRILVATDIAARGIDVKGIELVLNYDLPQHPENYVHRIGRTGRIGGIGHAISFATPDQKNDVRSIERLIRATLPLSALPQMPPARMPLNAPKKPAIIAPKPAVPAGHRRHYRRF
ncbi:MAG: DEAD/DEAH box helicase domain protein [Candidatus Azambacteria bacterium GW2011_GWA2_42_9]|uniref:DEAD/DEAH box helicase domain protein n=3 Tax=Candidatus Azamiibacteriota TaxID=1752741 RepID=A0A0G1BK19_9BACT|nr:MAG: DEAD/DEAH box helicase domain protein [Candidatus Azambacteria bacterium GW2011_GWA1_42_19]KKS75805.1 MAG: DEAD/DEAH box helicase domain protein [Candidatus Azambacteria bacterium GW2011_GWA2_42_9]KKS88917.1 MAG: DEAD/DEAH box helicase domain protein [Parcubacteria group bacterium GW2011_GWC1_43_11]